MSKDFGSVHERPVVMVGGPMVWHGICMDCHQEWEMTSGEKMWWDEMVRKGMTFPKRCKPCREKKRAVPQNKTLNSVRDVIGKLEEMSMSAINDMYDNRGDFLAQELADLARVLEERK